MSFCASFSYAEGVGWYVSSQGGVAPQDSYCEMVISTKEEWLASAPGVPASSPFSDAEIAQLKYQAANPSPLNLSPAEGAQVGGAIVLTWAAIFAVRALIRALNVDGDFEK